MKNAVTILAIVVFCAFISYLNIQAKNKAEYQQCDGSTRFYAYTGKIYSCDNYKKSPQGQQLDSLEWTNN